MFDHPLRRFSAACCCFVSLLLSPAQAEPSAPVGAINGNIAVKVVPVIPDRTGETRPLPTEDCAVHLVEADEQTTPWIYPCGQWFQPAVGRYLFWLEQRSTVSFQSILSYAGEPFTGSGLMLPKTMYPSGYVQLKKGTRIPADATFRLISLESVEAHRPYDRRIASKHAGEPVRIPVGKMIAGIFDRSGQALALSRPSEVSAGGTTIADPVAAAANRSAIVAVFSRPGSPGPIPCTIALTSDQSTIRPAVNFQTQERIVIVWYELAPAPVRLEVACGDTQPFHRSLRLKPGTIETVRAKLARPLPPIRVPD